jgi:uncharacterized protein YndB with AHSA1/START domain
MSRTLKIAPVRKSVHVRTDPAHAFGVFTARLGRWWPKTHHLGASMKDAFIEPFVGGCWYELADDGTRTNVGQVRLWDPPRRLIVSWDVSSQWTPDAAVASEVEVRFTASGDGTRVELEHRNFEALGPDGGPSLRRDVDGGWQGLLDLFRIEAEAPTDED